MSPLLIGFEVAPSSPLLIGLRRVERGVRRLDPLDGFASESGEGLAAALSTVSSDRDDEEDLRLELGLAAEFDPDALLDEAFEELRLEELRLDEALAVRRPADFASSPVGCSRRFSFEPELEDFEELREERFGGATRAVSQYGQSFQSMPTGLEQVGHSSLSRVRQDGHRMNSDSVGKPHL